MQCVTWEMVVGARGDCGTWVCRKSLPGWGFTMAKLEDNEVRDKIKRESPDYYDPKYIPDAESLLHHIMYVFGGRGGDLRLCFLLSSVSIPT